VSIETIFDDILNDTLLMGSLAASIWVKNPASQTTAGKVINAVALLLQTIDAQMGIKPAQPTTPTATS